MSRDPLEPFVRLAQEMALRSQEIAAQIDALTAERGALDRVRWDLENRIAQARKLLCVASSGPKKEEAAP